VLLAYIPKNFLDPILREIYETGHSKSLGPVSPATLGLDILLRRSTEVTFPCVSLSCQKDRWIVSLHGVYGWEGSHSLSVSGEEDVFAGFQKLVKSFPFSLSKEAMASVYAVGVSNPAIQDFILKDPCNDLKNLSNICGQNGKVTWGLCAASLGLSSYPAISFQEGIRHKPLHLRLKPYQFVVGATAAAIILITGFQGFQLQQSIQSIHKMEQEVDKLQTSLSPMLDLQKQLTQIENKLKDIEDFKSQQVSELKALKALAELTPPETWIKSFHLENGKLKVMAEGGSAVKTMSNWRQSSLFSEVRLVSPVRKYGQRGERFTVEMKLISVEEGAGSGD
jgi:Tfp pilus assembly protein PilN